MNKSENLTNKESNFPDTNGEISVFSLKEINKRISAIQCVEDSLHKKLKFVNKDLSNPLRFLFRKKFKKINEENLCVKNTIESLLIHLGEKRKDLNNMKAIHFNESLPKQDDVMQMIFLTNAINVQLSNIDKSILYVKEKINSLNVELSVVNKALLEPTPFKEIFIKFFTEVDFNEAQKFDSKYKNDLEKTLAHYSTIIQNLMDKKAYILSCKERLNQKAVA